MSTTVSGQNTYLSFRIAGDVFAFDISNVIEVLEQQSVTFVPKTSPHIKGVTNFRGNLLPVIDLGCKLGVEIDSKKSVIVVLEQRDKGKTFFHGALVDSVVGVQQLNHKDIQPFPDMKTAFTREYVTGLYKKGSDYTIIIDNRIISD